MGITLDEAMKGHTEKERRFLHPLNSEALVSHIQLHIRIFEEAPRDPIVIEKRIAIKKKERTRCNDAIGTDELSTEIEA